MSANRSCLIISYGPVPTDHYQTIEGGGMRVWGLATGLHANGADVTVAIHESFPQNVPEHKGVKLINWSIDRLAGIANTYDSVLMSYNMGEPSGVVAKKLSDSVQLILDAYVPIYVEISARRSSHLEQEYLNYMKELKRFDLSLNRGDYFICANPTQQTFYTGVLSALGRINPITYTDNFIEVVPFGIESTPPKLTKAQKVPGMKKDVFTVLWFGGLYPWFDIRSLIRAIGRLNTEGKKIQLLVVGGKNPFNPDPTFSKQYDETVAYTAAEGLKDTSIFFVDWVDYSTRANWYELADVVISINTEGQENRFSWRTRVMDYVWGGLPIASNGGDPLSDYLIENDAALKLEDISEEGLIKSLEHLHANPKALKDLKKNLMPLRPGFYWENVTKHLATVIEKGQRASDLALDDTVKTALKEARRNAHLNRALSNRYVKIGRKAGGFVKRYGVRSSLRQVQFGVRHIIKSRSNKRQYVFLAHPLDNSGGPLVLMEMLEEFQQQVGSKTMRLIAPHITPNHLKNLRRLGITLDGMDPRMGQFALGARLSIKADDFVLMNTSAISKNYRDAILRYLADGRLNHAYWYIHEDDPEIQFTDQKVVDRITQLIQNGKLTIGVPSVGMQKHYKEFFKGPISIIPLHVDIDEKYKHPRKASDYESMNFVLSGTSVTARKGQPLAIAAFYKFLVDSYKGNEAKYRDFTLTFIGLGKDYLSRQLITTGEGGLKKHFRYFTSVDRESAVDIMSESNAVICCSLMEAFGLYVAEGMYMGHIVLRNDCSGMEEQLKPGTNGFRLETDDIQQFADVIERILNKKTTSNEQLRKMGASSQDMISGYADHNYYKSLMKLEQEKE